MSCLDKSPPALGYGSSVPTRVNPNEEKLEIHKKYFFEKLEEGKDPVRMNRHPSGIDSDILAELFWSLTADGWVNADAKWNIMLLQNPYKI